MINRSRAAVPVGLGPTSGGRKRSGPRKGRIEDEGRIVADSPKKNEYGNDERVRDVINFIDKKNDEDVHPPRFKINVMLALNPQRFPNRIQQMHYFFVGVGFGVNSK
jgi:hypothetical protein